MDASGALPICPQKRNRAARPPWRAIHESTAPVPTDRLYTNGVAFNEGGQVAAAKVRLRLTIQAADEDATWPAGPHV